jgi:hypothetical protein
MGHLTHRNEPHDRCASPLDRAKGVTVSHRLDEGAYRITFNRDVSECACSATIDLSVPGEGHTGEVYVSRDDDSPTVPTAPRQVDVATYLSGGTSNSDNRFDLIVHCRAPSPPEYLCTDVSSPE